MSVINGALSADMRERQRVSAAEADARRRAADRARFTMGMTPEQIAEYDAIEARSVPVEHDGHLAARRFSLGTETQQDRDNLYAAAGRDPVADKQAAWLDYKAKNEADLAAARQDPALAARMEAARPSVAGAVLQDPSGQSNRVREAFGVVNRLENISDRTPEETSNLRADIFNREMQQSRPTYLGTVGQNELNNYLTQAQVRTGAEDRRAAMDAARPRTPSLPSYNFPSPASSTPPQQQQAAPTTPWGQQRNADVKPWQRLPSYRR